MSDEDNRATRRLDSLCSCEGLVEMVGGWERRVRSIHPGRDESTHGVQGRELTARTTVHRSKDFDRDVAFQRPGNEAEDAGIHSSWSASDFLDKAVPDLPSQSPLHDGTV